jgi:hypothetical protein
LGDDQSEKSQGEERLGDSFSGGGFHYGGQLNTNRFPCQALPRSSLRKPRQTLVEIAVVWRMSMSCQRWKTSCPRWMEGR